MTTYIETEKGKLQSFLVDQMTFKRLSIKPFSQSVVLATDFEVGEPDEIIALCDKETNEILGFAKVFNYFSPMYVRKGELPQERLSEERYYAIKDIYYRWCSFRNLKPNPKEGWFKSKKFMDYLKSIGWDNQGFNFVLFVDEVESVNKGE